MLKKCKVSHITQFDGSIDINIEDESHNIISSTKEDFKGPTPSLVFITKYIKNINQNSDNIEEVLVDFIDNTTVKTRPDNTIIIRKVNDFCSKEQIKEIIYSFAQKFVPEIDNPSKITEVSDWVTSNL